MDLGAARHSEENAAISRIPGALANIELDSRLETMLAILVPAWGTWAAISLPLDSGGARIAAVRYVDRTRALRSAFAFGATVTDPLDDFVVRTAIGASIHEGITTFPLNQSASPVGWLHLGAESTHVSAGRTRAAMPGVLEIFALALADSIAYERERQVARTFQRAALTSHLPSVAGVTFDAVYEPGHADQLVGGDWYDAFVLPDGRIVVSVGDAVGSGLQAAVVMVNVRQSIRGIAHIHGDPAAILQAADEVLQGQHPDRFVTAFLAIFDPATHLCVYSNAGHPPPLVRQNGGAVRELYGRDVPLGTGYLASAARSVEHTILDTGSMLVLYTDGLIEAQRDILQAQSALTAAVAALQTSYQAASTIRNSLLPAHAPDDVAILAMRIDREPNLTRWRFDPRWSDASWRVRNEMREILRSQAGFTEDATITAELIFSELVANLLAYAPRLAEMILHKTKDAWVMHVLDRGPGFQFIPRLPADIFSQSGRGLFLISTLAREFSVERRPGGGSHARIVLRQ